MAESIPEWLLEQYKEGAKFERQADTTIVVYKLNGYMSIEFAEDPDSGYYFSGEDFDKMMEEVPDNISPEDYFLAQVMNW